MKKWEVKKLDEVCEFGNGLWTGKKPPFIKVGVIRNTNFTKDCQLDDSDIAYLDVERSQFANRKLQYGDIVLEKSGGGPKQPVGRVVIFDKQEGNFSFSNFTSIVRVKNKSQLDFRYLHKYLFNAYLSGITEKMQSHSTGIRNLKFDAYKQITIPIPPLPEQQRIVSMLDESFAAVAAAKENTERNLVNARELFDSYVESIFAKSSKEWEEKKLGDKEIIEIIDNDRGVNYPKKSDFHAEGYCLFMNTKNVRPDGFEFTTTMFITEKKDKALNKGKLSRNDVVMTTRGTIGNLGIYNDKVEYEHVRINSGMLIFRPNLKYIVPEYLFGILQSGIIKSQIKKHVSGAAQPQLPIKTLVSFTFPLPKSIAEQRAIVAKLDALSAETKRLEEIYERKVDGLEELKRSVLGRVFDPHPPSPKSDS